MHSLAQRLLTHIRRHELLTAGERVGVAVSGGIDSVALLRLLLDLCGDLGIVLSVIHFNHRLRGAESEADQEFVAGLARDYHLEFHCDGGDVARQAEMDRAGMEAAARELRYGFFRGLLGVDEGAGQEVKTPTLSRLAREGWGTLTDLKNLPALDKVATGHTLDDQAETVLLRIIRGSGLRGIAGIHPRILVENEDGEACGEIVRPLLATRRSDLEHYLRGLGQSWRDDVTNDSLTFTRNRLRKLVLPLLEKEFNPAVAHNLAELAEIARGEEDYWANEVAGWMGTGVHWSEPAWARKAELVQIRTPGASSVQATSEGDDLENEDSHAPWLVMDASVDRLWFLGEPPAVQRRVIKAIGEEAGITLGFRHVEEVLQFATQQGESGREIPLPLGWKVRREPDEILFLTPNLRQSGPALDYEYELPVPGEVDVCEIGTTVEARCVPPDAGYNPEHLLDGNSLPSTLKLRNWRAGDRFWPNHRKSPKKVKELLQERHVPQPERKMWPVAVSGSELLWMRGFPPAARFAAKPGQATIAILERPIGSER
ncbi:MAG TPA: tRNA lysidine(34) synthetase TilS [Candidatus Sulfotelmatobacter sp.]|nr:tRNA lysidine(34) synthetase TilS [Candidatus Sulfotelmatobacter sp.]